MIFLEFLKKHKKLFLVLISIFLLIVITLTSLYKTSPTAFEKAVSFVVSPFQSAVNFVTNGISNFFSFTSDVDQLNSENATLKERIVILEEENKRLSLFEKENEELTKLVEIRQIFQNYERIGANVIAKDSSNWYSMFTIDRGSNDNIEEDMFVIAEGGLVGRIYNVYPTSSEVLSLIDDRSAVYAESKETSDTGVIKGSIAYINNMELKMDYIDLHSEMSVGNEIITSSLSQKYPAGITIGYVKEIKTESNGLTKYATIEPSVDFKYLRKVLVVSNTKKEVGQE